MKQFKKIFLLLILALGMIAVASCDDSVATFYKVEFNSNGGSAVAAQTVKTGELAVEPEAPTLKWHDFIGWYKDEALTVEYDFTTPVTANVKLYAKWQMQEVEPVIEILDVSKPSNLLLFENNKKEKENKRTEFFDLTQAYVVGDDNPWTLKPAVTFIAVDPITDDWEETIVASWEYVVAVYVLKNTQYEKLAEENEYVDAINATNASVDFSENAVGEKFKIEVYPEGLTETQLENIANYTVSAEIEVVDGYNVYSELEFAYVDNRTAEEDFFAEWNAFKTANGLDVSLRPANVILHKNLEITKEHLPAEMFYQEGDEDLKPSDSDYERTLGAMRDYTDLYNHVFTGSESFGIYGNYFQVSSKTLPTVTRENDEISVEGTVISHSVFLRFSGAEAGQANLENISLVGNAPRVEDSIKAGGLIMTQTEGPAFKAYNNIVTASFIAYFPELTFATYEMEKCKAYDSFNCFVYNWGSDKVFITDCEMKDAGGPVIIQDHVDHESDGTGGNLAKTTIVNSDLESYVNGQEGWFTVVGASALIAPVVGMDQLLNPFGKSFLSTNTTNGYKYFNMICINKSGSSQSPTNVKVGGYVKIDDYAPFDYGVSSPSLTAVKAIAEQVGAPYFETSAGGAAFTDAQTGLFSSNIIGMDGSTPIFEQIIDPANGMYQGEYLVLYYSGMMVVFQYGNVGATHTPGM